MTKPTRHSKAAAATLLCLPFVFLSLGCSDSEPPSTETAPETTAPETPEAAMPPAKEKASEAPKEAQSAAKPIESGPAETEPPADKPEFWSEVLLHRAIREANAGYSGNGQFRINEQGQPDAMVLAGCGVSDISILAGMPLMMLDLQACPVESIAVLKGMPLVELFLDKSNVEDLSPLAGNKTLKKIYLNETNVKDLAPLKGMPLEELNLVGARVEDITPLSGMPLKMLWLTGLPVSDISPLATMPLQSVTLHRTKVENLQPLATLSSLQRIHIGETPVKDLTPITRLPLTRLVFTPATVEKGVDGIRQIRSMQQLGVDFENDMKTLMSPPEFWAKFDAGEFK